MQMFKSDPGVRRPLLYVIAAALSVAMAIPLASGSGQTLAGGIFDECYDAGCDGYVRTAQAPN